MKRRIGLAAVAVLSACFAAPIAFAQTQTQAPPHVIGGTDRANVERMREKQQLRREIKERQDEVRTEAVRRMTSKCTKSDTSRHDDASAPQAAERKQDTECESEAAAK